jgi:SAM-dependent methyltransferase
MDGDAYWDRVYASKGDAELSWYEPEPRRSMELILDVSHGSGRVIDVGGGSSVLVDRLLDQRFDRIAVLDISHVALERAKARLGERAARVEWIEADVTKVDDLGQFDVWHDRAVFHFMTEPADRAAYAALLSRTVSVGGHAIIATFALDGPETCSGLPVRRYDGQSLAGELGAGIDLVKSVPETHLTSWGKPQSFQYSLFRHV